MKDKKYENKKFMIYGCNGFLGKQIVSTAIKRGLENNLIIAGRTEKSVFQVADNNLIPREQCRIFSLYDKNISKNFEDIDILLNCAGPHYETYEELIKICLKYKVHYLDINGEIDVFENLAKYDSIAKESNIIILPGCGLNIPR
jgi:short subunit dehydrogenase-like uncharacterized protein